MELGLSLGDGICMGEKMEVGRRVGDKVGFAIGLGLGFGRSGEEEDEEEDVENEGNEVGNERGRYRETRSSTESPPPPVQLDLLPPAPVTRLLGFPWSSSETRRTESSPAARGFDVNQAPDSDDGGLQMDFSIHRRGGGSAERVSIVAGEPERSSSRASDEEENGGAADAAAARKKLRLSKEQSAFLEESFKEHNTLNPKQKMALAKKLNLRPRQIEVWFQNRRARTKLKQTEVDCEYLKRCCETLTEENRRLHKELAELRALKAADNPSFSRLPATTLSMCPSCERVAQITTPAAAPSSGNVGAPSDRSRNKQFVPPQLLNSPPRFFPFSAHRQPSAAT